MKRLAILGSTGSIGTQALDVVRRLPSEFEVVGLSAHRNADLLAEQIREFHPRAVAVADSGAAAELERSGTAGIPVHCGVAGLCAVAAETGADLVLVAVAGAIGIAPTHAAIAAGKDIALASKEVLVAAGESTMQLVRRHGVRLLPVDSEHSAIFQCIQGAAPAQVERIQITASGGPFRSTPASDLASVTPEQALRHPTWTMGGLVTINSATLMNKALESIEAHWLFGVPMDRIEIVVHPQSIVHSFVRFSDGSTIAQLGLPDMRLPIQLAMTWPERPDTGLPRLDICALGRLDFEPPDPHRFPAVHLAAAAMERGGTTPAVMNAANEAAVGMFLERAIGYNRIVDIVRSAMAAHDPMEDTLDNVLAADRWGREFAASAQ